MISQITKASKGQPRKTPKLERKYVPTRTSKTPQSTPRRRQSRAPRQGMLGLAVRSRVPTVRSSVLNSMRTLVRGTEFLSTVTGTTTATTGTTLVTQLIGPHSLGVGRLAAFASLYEKYRFRRFIVRYVPIANATVSGQVMGYFDMDPTEIPTSTTPLAAFQRGVAHFGARSNNVWEPRDFEMKDDDPTRLLYTSNVTATEPSERMVYQSRFSLLAASALTAVALGNLYLDYEIEFVNPQIDSVPASTAATGAKISSGGSVSDSSPLGSAPVIAVGSNIPALTISSTSVITLPKGTWIAVYRATAGVVAALDLTAGSSAPLTVQVDAPDYFLTSPTAGLAMLKVKATDTWTLTPSCTTSGGHGAAASEWVYIASMPTELVLTPAPALTDRVAELERKYAILPGKQSPTEQKEVKTPSAASADFTIIDTPRRSHSTDRSIKLGTFH